MSFRLFNDTQSKEYREFVELLKETAEHSTEGAHAREAMAATLRLPLNREVEHQNIARTMFMVDKLPPGAQSMYPFDIEPIDAITLPRIGAAPVHHIGVTELHVPCFRVTSSAEWDLQLAQDGRIDIVERAMWGLRNGIVRYENQAAWQIVREAVDESNTVSGGDEGAFSKKALNNGFAAMESQDGHSVDLVIVNAKKAAEVRGWSSTDLDPVTMREVWRNSGVGRIWGADIIIDNSVGDDEAFLIDTSLMGIMCIRRDLVTFDDPTAIRQFRQAIVGYEEIGFAVVRKSAIVKISL